MNDKKKDYVQITTKLSPESFARMRELCARKQMKPYTMLQMMVDTAIRYMDDRHNLTPELEEVMRIFEHMDGWEGSISWTDWDGKAEIKEATYYVANDCKKGVRAVHVERPFFGDWSENRNIQDILERTLCLLLPNRYKKLRQMAVEMECNSLLELIDKLCDEHTDEADIRELRKTFEENRMTEYGRKMWEQKFKRKSKVDIDKAVPSLGFRPFDQEE